MTPEEFMPAAAGDLVDVPGGWAFVPHLLPPELPATWEMAAKLETAAEAMARVAGRAGVIPNRTLLIRPLLTREAVESNRLEGTHTQIEDVLRSEVAGAPKDAHYADRIREVNTYLAATAEGETWVNEDRPMTSFLLRALHKELISGTRGHDRRPGEFRRRQVIIGDRDDTPLTARFVPPPPEHIEPAVENLVEFIERDRRYPAIVSAAIAHYQFETIHPFEDGNGRLGRLLIPLHLMRRQLMDAPLVNLSPFFESVRDKYLDTLKRVSTHGEWASWIGLFLDAVRAQSDDACRRADTLLELRERYGAVARERFRSRTALLAVDFLMERVFVTAAGLAAFAGCTYNTARTALEGLASAGILEADPAAYPQRWIAKELFDLVYR